MPLHNQQGHTPAYTADTILDLISRYLPQLWHTQRLSNSRCLRLVLLSAEQCHEQGTAAETVSSLLSEYLPQLWAVQERSGSRQLRTVLNAAERVQVLLGSRTAASRASHYSQGERPAI